MADFIIKYKPTKLSHIVGNRKAVTLIKHWIDTFDPDTGKQIMLITGKSGLGKTSIAEVIFNNNDFEAKPLQLNHLTDLNIIKDRIISTVTCANINMLMFGGKKPGIIIDEIENIYAHGSRDFINEFIKMFKTIKSKYPIICTTNITSVNKLTSFRTIGEIVTLTLPTQSEITKYAKKILKKQNMHIESNILEFIIEYSEYDIRKLLIDLYDIYCRYGTNIVTDDNIKDIYSSIQKKDIDMSLSQIIKISVTGPIHYNDILTLFYLDSYLLPNLIYENIPNIVYKNNELSNHNKLNIYKNGLDNLILADQFQNKSFSPNCFPQDYTGVFALKSINNITPYLESYSPITKITLSNKAAEFSKRQKQLCIYNKKTYLSYSEIEMFANILYHYLYKTKQYDIIVQLLRQYNITIYDITNIIKLNKLNVVKSMTKVVERKILALVTQ
jgi:DNA polymerase III delta prime subunit